MLDRVREALFATLAPWLPDARVLDLFAGSGALALEALSRGARAARVVERHAATLALLQTNVATLGLGDRVESVRGDALAPASWRGGALFAGQRYDLVFLDPPYAQLDTAPGKRAVLAALATLVRDHLAPDGYLLLHAPRARLDANDFPPNVIPALREYGTNALWYVAPPSERSTPPS
jgi:16S rRNA (guanine966-N2)-methyltransferase